MKSSTINFGQITTILLLGGGPVLSRLALHVRELGLRLAVFTSPRHLVARLVEFDLTFEQFLHKEAIDLISCESISEEPMVAEYEGETTLAISFGAPWIFDREFIDRFGQRLLNVHGAPLPQHRGAGGFSWRIMTGDYAGCSLIHVIDEGVDTGPIVRQQPFRFPDDCRIPADFEHFQGQRDLVFLDEFLRDVEDGRSFDLTSQSEEESTYFPRLYTPKHGAVDWRWSAQALIRFIRAFDDPYSGAFTLLEEERMTLRGACLLSGDGPFHPYQAGLVYRVNDEQACIATLEGGSIGVTAILNANGDNLVLSLRPGARLHTPEELLGEARRFRAVYTPVGIRL